MSTYKVDTENFGKAMTELIEAFKREHPSVGSYKMVLKDHSTVTIRIKFDKSASKPVKTA